MNLYRIKVCHGACKSSHTAIEQYLIAENDEQVYDHIDRIHNHGAWNDKHTEDDLDSEPHEYFAESDEDMVTPIKYRDKVIADQGNLNDDHAWDDAYYGVTLWGWELVCEGIESVKANPNHIGRTCAYRLLIALGIAVEYEACIGEPNTPL